MTTPAPTVVKTITEADDASTNLMNNTLKRLGVTENVDTSVI